MAGLPPKHARFVAEYAKDLNATQAAIRAGYSVKTAASQGARLLTNAKIQAAVAALNAKALAKAEVTVERIVSEFSRYAFAEAPDAYEGVEHRDRIKALENLGKHKAIFTERHLHTFEEMTDEQLEARYRELVAKGTGSAT